MSDRLKNRFRGTPTPNIENDISTVNKQLNQYFFAPNQNNKQQNIGDIIKATREQNFVSPFINMPEKGTVSQFIDNTTVDRPITYDNIPEDIKEKINQRKKVVDLPRSRKVDPVTKGIAEGFSTPLLGAYSELAQSGDEFKKGDIKGGITDLLRGSFHTAILPVVTPLNTALGGADGSGVLKPIVEGISKTINLPFDAIKQGSELVKRTFDTIGLPLPTEGKASARLNELITEIAGFYALGKTHKEAKLYIDRKLPEIKLEFEPKFNIKSEVNTPVEGLTQEKLPTDILKGDLPKQEPVELSPKIETPIRGDRTPLFEKNKIVINDILDKEGLLTPRQVSRRLTSLVEKGDIKKKISVDSIKEIVDEWNANRPKRPLQEIKGTENDLGIALPKEMNDTRAVSFDRRSGLTVKEVLEQNPEFKPYVKDLKDINEVTTQLNSLYWKKRYKEPLPELPQEKTPETSFNFGENDPNKGMTSIQNAVVNEKRIDRGVEPLQKPETLSTEVVMNEAKRKIDTGEVDANKLAKEILDNPRGVVQEQEAILDANMRKLENDRVRLADEISKETDPAIKQKKIEEAEYLQELYDLNDLAANQLGTDTARALQIREMGRRDNYSIAPVLRTAKIANKGQDIPQEVKTKLEEYSQQITRGEKELQEVRRQLKLEQAKNILDKAVSSEKFQERTKRRQVVKQNLDVEYENLIKEFAKSQQFNALIDPHQVNLLIKCARNRFKKGVVNVEQLVDQLYQDVKQFMPELTKDDVIDAIVGSGKYKRMTEGDISLELRKLRKEISDSKTLETRKTKLLNQEAELKQMLESGNFEKTPRRIVEDTPEIREIRDRVDVLKQRVDREIRQLELANRTPQEKFAANVIDATNIPRTLMSSFDLSAPLRQGAILFSSYPKIVAGEHGAFREMFKYFESEKGIRELQRQIEDSPNAPLYIKTKLFLANERKNIGRLEGREESYMSTSPERLKIIGAGIRASNRAYAGFLDKARMDVFDYHVEQFKKAGITFENNPKAYKDLAKLVNIMSGRGTLGGFEKSATALTSFIYSPRLIASRLQFLDPRNLYKLDPAVRKIWIKDSIKFYGVGMSILTMAKLAGADVDLHPNSSDFLKIRIGNTRLDIWGGFQQYATLIAKISMGTQNVEGRNKKINRLDTGLRFALQKASPSAGFVRDFLKGKNMVGEPFDLTNEAVNLLTPLFFQDMYDAISEDGMIGAIKGMPGAFGVGVQTYKPKKSKLK